MQNEATTIQRIPCPTGHNLTTFNYKGQPCWIAQEIGQVLGYSSNGSRLVNKITQDWSDEVIEGEDYFKVEGLELAALRDVVSQFASTESVGAKLDPPESGGSNPLDPQTRRLLLLTERGVWLACIKSNKPAGRQLRRWLSDEVLPTLRRKGSYSVPGASVIPEDLDGQIDLMHELAQRLAQQGVEAHQLGVQPGRRRIGPRSFEGAQKTRLSVDVPAQLAEEARATCYWRHETLTRSIVEALDSWVLEAQAEPAFFIDPDTSLPRSKPAGQPYPPQPEPLKQGRPLSRR